MEKKELDIYFFKICTHLAETSFSFKPPKVHSTLTGTSDLTLHLRT